MIEKSELQRRWSALQSIMKREAVSGMLVSSNVNIFYTCGQVVSGYVFIPLDGDVTVFVRRPEGLEGVTYIRKFEDIASVLPSNIFSEPVMMECDSASYSEINRYTALFKGELKNGSTALREARSIKTDYELELIRKSALSHTATYRRVPLLFKEGMSDVELSVEIEKELRLEGSLGIFRIGGSSMEIFAGSLLVGDNADTPSPYDFAMGGQGLNPSIPGGANGTIIEGNKSVMVDFGGNFTGYMSDMTRVYSIGYLGETANRAHQTSIAICREIERIAGEGVAASELYCIAYEMAAEAGFEDYFMGHKQKAAFVGHGIGLEINEAPVLAPRSRDILKKGMVFALEPKFVIPGVGAVGIENTYIVGEEGVERVTLADEQILPLNIFGQN